MDDLHQLKETWGKEFNYKRCRPNLLISLIGKEPFIEETWSERRMKIGPEVEILIKRYCERCMIITVDSEDGSKEPSLLKTVTNKRDNHSVIYVFVLKTGNIKTGDDVILLD